MIQKITKCTPYSPSAIALDPAVDSVEVVVGEVPCCVELVSPCAVVALDMSVEFGGSGREFEEVDASALAFAFEVGFELGAAIDLDGLDGEGHGFLEFVEEAFGVVSGCASPGLRACPPGYGVVCGELLNGGSSCGPGDGEGVELDGFSGPGGFAPCGQPSGAGAFASCGAGGVSAEVGDGEDGLSPHGIVVAGLAHGRDRRRRPLRPAHAARERFEASAFGALSPAVEGRKGHADRSRRRAGVQAVRAGLLPAFEGVLLV